MILPIYLEPQPVLLEKTADVSADELTSEKFHAQLDDMLETMRGADGVGLAAPQVGMSKRFALVDAKAIGLEGMGEVIELINPKITKKSFHKVVIEEGCLSIPGIYGNVKRPEKITVSYVSRDGEPQELQAEGFLARVIQHEVDHLDGVLFTSKVIDYTKEERVTPKYPHVT